MLFALGLHRHLRERRADRPVPRQCGRRRAAVGHHVRRRPFPHGDGRGADPGDLRRDLPLVPEDHRAHARTRRWASSTSGSRSSAPMRSSSRCTISACWACRAATTNSATRPSSRHRRTTLNAFITVAALIVGFAQMVFLFNLIWSLVKGKRGRRQSLAGHHARMADARNAAGARQLGQGAAGRLSLGLRLQRAGRQARISSRRTSRRPHEPRREHGMSVILVFLAGDRRHRRLVAVAAAADGQALARGRARSATCRGTRAVPLPAAKIGLRRLPCRRRLPVRAASSAPISCAWSCADWRPLPVPRLLWLNTGVLVLSSVALQWALVAARRRAAWTRVQARPRHRRRHGVRLPGRPAHGLATADRRRLFPGRQSGQQLLLPDHRRCTGCTSLAAWWRLAATTARRWRGWRRGAGCA